MRVVLDTNIIVSAQFWGGVPQTVYDAALSDKYALLASEELINEIVRVLNYPKFASHLKRIDKTPMI